LKLIMTLIFLGYALYLVLKERKGSREKIESLESVGSLTTAVPLEKQLEQVLSCGIDFAPGITISNLLDLFDREQYEKDPYFLLLSALGGETEDDDPHLLSNDIWYFDTECIEDDGDYSTITERFGLLAGNAMQLENIRDHVSVESGEAWVQFELDGKKYKWDARVDDDWCDTEILSKFARLLEGRNTGKRFVTSDLGGQDMLITCASEEQLKCLQSLGLKFDWMV